ncbi:SDR family NAD(P)-dependent oxidoreductase [Alkalicoccus daliensis]|uniref:UDP-glucose 4-epimerase n=1 Tax=Alkalicoccus daliensis TaxID=745820 RepID=A0A1H0GHU8_9BACI|nr:SDR family NAD(P)-dependent oxidoreductase [Alkalicoccus daliensis]SDO06392.1 UDP-glucose 4-epimerase [Alkalicoccus daliensis]
MKTILITGGAGFIGSHTVELLLRRDYQVIILDNLSSGDRNNVPEQAVFIEGDIRDEKGTARIFAEYSIDGVIHLAAQSKVGPSVERPEEDMAINVLGTVNLLQAAQKYHTRKFVFASSAAVYGHVEELPVTEASPTAPLSPYGTSKLAAEAYIQMFHRLYGFEIGILRFSNVYGPRQTAATEAGVITIFIDQLLAGEAPTIQGDGQQTRDFVYVEDVAAAIFASLEQPQQDNPVYNVSTSSQTSVETLLKKLSEAAGKPFFPKYAEERAGDIKHSYLTYKHLAQSFGWKPEVPLDRGIAETMKYYRSLAENG